MIRKGLGKGTGMRGYYNLTPLDSHIHSLNAKGIKTGFYDRYYGLETLRKRESKLIQIEEGLALPQLGALAVRSVSAMAGLGFDAPEGVIPLVGLALFGVAGLVYSEEKKEEADLIEKFRKEGEPEIKKGVTKKLFAKSTPIY